jgi:hypothetical protein
MVNLQAKKANPQLRENASACYSANGTSEKRYFSAVQQVVTTAKLSAFPPCGYWLGEKRR